MLNSSSAAKRHVNMRLDNVIWKYASYKKLDSDSFFAWIKNINKTFQKI